LKVPPCGDSSMIALGQGLPVWRNLPERRSNALGRPRSFHDRGVAFSILNEDFSDAVKHSRVFLWRIMMTRHITKVLYSAVVGVFLSTVCFGIDLGSLLPDQITAVNDLIDKKLKTLSASQKIAVNDLIDTRLKTLSASQTAAVNDLIDTRLKTLSASQTSAANDLIDRELKNFGDWETAKVGDLIDTKLKTLSDAQTAKVNALIDTKLKTLSDSQTAKGLNDAQTAKLNEMIDMKLKTLSDSQTKKLNNLIDIKLNNLSDAQAEKNNEHRTIDAILSNINTKIDDIRRHLSREQRGYVVEQEDECGCQGDLRWSRSAAHDHRR